MANLPLKMEAEDGQWTCKCCQIKGAHGTADAAKCARVRSESNLEVRMICTVVHKVYVKQNRTKAMSLF